MKLKIQTGLNNKILRTIAEEVENFSEEKLFIKKLKNFLETSEDGVGVAAPQVGYSKRIFIITLEKNKCNIDKNNLTVVINPKILKFSKKKVIGQEGCLSIPGVFGDVERSKKILVEYFNEVGKKIKMELKGFGAIVFQHEFDHLNGVLFFDKIINGEFVMDEGMDKKSLEKLGISI